MPKVDVVVAFLALLQPLFVEFLKEHSAFRRRPALTAFCFSFLVSLLCSLLFADEAGYSLYGIVKLSALSFLIATATYRVFLKKECEEEAHDGQ